VTGVTPEQHPVRPRVWNVLTVWSSSPERAIRPSHQLVSIRELNWQDEWPLKYAHVDASTRDKTALAYQFNGNILLILKNSRDLCRKKPTSALF
jgi:hypothetical protein